MDLDDLFFRESLVDAPVAVLIRADVDSEMQTLHSVRNALDLLVPLRQGGEVVVVARHGNLAANQIPARVANVRVRWLFVNDPSNGSSLERGIAECRCPAIVAWDVRVQPNQNELAALLRSLNQADLVVGRRAGWSICFPLDWIVRWLAATPVSDPLCPVRALRKWAVCGVVLETNAPVADAELIAKMTFRTALLDEVPISSGRHESIFLALCRLGKSMVRTALVPRFGKRYNDKPTKAIVDSRAPVKTLPWIDKRVVRQQDLQSIPKLLTGAFPRNSL